MREMAMRPSMVSRATVLAVTLVLCVGLAACGDDDEPGADRPGPVATVAPEDAAGAAGGGAASMCLAAITYRDRMYVGAQVPDLAVGGEAGEAVSPPCNDTGSTIDDPAPAPFPVLSIDGIDPSVAVATRAEAGGYWVWYAPVGDMQAPDAVQALLD